MVLQLVRNVIKTYPVSRGMITYAMAWPMANVSQQLIAGQSEIDVPRALRFGLFGSCFMAPFVYNWIRISARIFPGTTFLVAVKKAWAEQISFAPAAISSFLIGINTLEGKSMDFIANEFKEKFIPTYQTGACFWPFIQTINFAFIKERNRASFVGVFSFLWTIFLSHVHQRKLKAAAEEEKQKLPE